MIALKEKPPAIPVAESLKKITEIYKTKTTTKPYFCSQPFLPSRAKGGEA